ncbi:SGNH/GDSL hydrolase family protein [Sulfitobacter sp. F26169L]|uniref:SGNH/GDSL hydrolase family protein n=1 Tax=Sulfitobacter sp. F26169L TaxID=2996015 RepID=UPI002260B397|nr:SGNH/GDSL hydrolase family protein [Sulfitobacter sp. F26169L]MCX7567029.1 SGNH/GDSL hydrolase family protein [Sulfitobacter sp. F26169L]
MIFDTVATLALSPLLLFQALRVRKHALRLPEAEGPRSGILGDGPPLHLLVIGDSSAAGVGADTQENALAGRMAHALAVQHTVHWRLIAQTGATTATTLTRLQSEDLPRADIVLIILGVNDVTRGGPRAIWLRKHTALRNLLRTRTGAKKLVISEVPPLGAFPLLPNPLRWLLGRRAARFDIALRRVLADEPDCSYVAFPNTLDVNDMAEDGYHPGPVIYAAWANELARRILSDGP